ncbi:hypothetical protein [Bombella apis]|uniref:GAF domain-containing protein n=1 Tax=Bombella apis TaxID=1785988 RepID=A0ABR9MP42_9PROT|nr:hypothetical protein [Bombella apis]MBE1723182.1 hypothetical protein [Bombella apis]MBR9730989.1 hypothetical protein [Bombella apis]
MTTAIDLCRRALMRLGTQSGITAFDDGSVEASVCAAYYDDVLLGLLAHPASFGGPAYTWQWPRCVGTGTAVASDSPLWRYEILMPEDSVRVLRVDDGKTVRPVDQRMTMFDRRDSFGEGMGKAGGTVLRPVILTDSQTVSVTYITRNVDIDYWPAAFRRAFWLCLASAIATTLGIDGNTIAAVEQEASREVERACLADQRVDVVSTETMPDWLDVRFSGLGYGHHIHQTSNTMAVGYVAGGSQPPSPTAAPYAPPMGPNGVIPTGLTARDIAEGDHQYIPADTPDGRVGILTIGRSPVGWRRPYHTTTINPNADDASGEYDR